MKPIRLLTGPLLLMLASCASDKAEPSSFKPLSQRVHESNGYKQDADGNWLPQQNKRSSFESQGRSAYFTGEYGKKTYQTDKYDGKTPWWGKKEAARPAYSGNTDGSAFHTASAQDGMTAPQAGASASIPGPYQTSTHETHSAREADFDPITKPGDAETNIRRRVYPTPLIIDWRERRKLTMDQSRSILGR